MNKIIPIANFVVSVIALCLSICAVVLSAVSKFAPPISMIAIVFIVIAFSISAINCGFAFVFTKSKLCVTAGVISAISVIINIAAFIILP